jgi:hypothetical protein
MLIKCLNVLHLGNKCDHLYPHKKLPLQQLNDKNTLKKL